MLENLRGMAVFASVVNQGSFSGAAKELGITTSAVSQQIRSLENDLGIVLLHRSTRKLSMTEAGQGYYDAAREVVTAAEKGRIKVNRLRDELAGSLRIATTPELGGQHILPALSSWMTEHEELNIHFLADNDYVDMIDERIDLAICMSANIKDSSLTTYPLSDIRQVLVASPSYLATHPPINTPKDLSAHRLIGFDLIKDFHQLELKHTETGKKSRIKMVTRIHSNNVFLATTLVKGGHGLFRVMEIDVADALKSGELVEVLPSYQLPVYHLYGVTLAQDQQPAKVERCLEVLQNYFANLSSSN